MAPRRSVALPRRAAAVAAFLLVRPWSASAQTEQPGNGGGSLAHLEVAAAQRLAEAALERAGKALDAVSAENAAWLQDAKSDDRAKAIRSKLESQVPAAVEGKKNQIRSKLNATRATLQVKEKENAEAEKQAKEEEDRLTEQEDGDKKAKKKAKKEAKKLKKENRKAEKEREQAIDDLKDDEEEYEKQLAGVSAAKVLSELIDDDLDAALAKVESHIDAVKSAAQGLSVASADFIAAEKADNVSTIELAVHKTDIERRSDILVYKAQSLGDMSKELIKRTYKGIVDDLAREEEVRHIEAEIKELQEKKAAANRARDDTQEEVIKSADATIEKVNGAEQHVQDAKGALDAADRRANAMVKQVHDLIGDFHAVNVTSIAAGIQERVKKQVADATAAAEEKLTAAKEALAHFGEDGGPSTPEDLQKLAKEADAASAEFARAQGADFAGELRAKAANIFTGAHLRAKVKEAADEAKKALATSADAANGYADAQKDVGIRKELYTARLEDAKRVQAAIAERLSNEEAAANSAVSSIVSDVRAKLGVTEANDDDNAEKGREDRKSAEGVEDVALVVASDRGSSTKWAPIGMLGVAVAALAAVRAAKNTRNIAIEPEPLLA